MRPQPQRRANRVVRLAAAGLLAMAGAAARADEVSVEHDGLDLLGNLELASGKALDKDGAVLLLHGTLAHHRMEIITALQAALKSRGVNSLAITLSLGLDKRRGMFDCKLEHDHRNGDAGEEIDAWLRWLRGKGAARIVLAGHSRGASQVAAYAAEKPDGTIDRLVLIAPLIGTPEQVASQYTKAFKKELAPVLAEAKRLVDGGEADTLMEGIDFLYCPKARVTAASFLDYYGPDPKLSTPELLNALKVPVLVVVASKDEGVPDLAAIARAAAVGPHVQLAPIEGADHFFRDLFIDDIADRVLPFLGRR